MVINKLQDYRISDAYIHHSGYKEKANRDRFIIPLEKDITFFSNIIDKLINFSNKINIKIKIVIVSKSVEPFQSDTMKT